MRILTVVGARPQFVKAAVVSRAIDDWNRRAGGRTIEEVLLHTGQHHDANMSQVFFDELEIRAPSINLQIAGGSHGEMTGRMIAAIEAEILRLSPDWVLVYGDTNSTLASALAAAKVHVPVAHVEAGLRSFNRRMPEEINRVLTDHVSAHLYCPTDAAVENLAREGITAGVVNVGDVMYDASLHYRDRADRQSQILESLDLAPGGYYLSTCHRAENTDEPARLRAILTALGDVAQSAPLVLPLHPRTRQAIQRHGLEALSARLVLVEPLPFLDMIRLEAHARAILTDSGGVQKEAYFFGVPCITMRDETEWVETVDSGWNQLAGANPSAIVAAAMKPERPPVRPSFYGDGDAGQRIVAALASGVHALAA